VLRVHGVLEGHSPRLESVLRSTVLVKAYEPVESFLDEVVFFQLRGQNATSQSLLHPLQDLRILQPKVSVVCTHPTVTHRQRQWLSGLGPDDREARSGRTAVGAGGNLRHGFLEIKFLVQLLQEMKPVLDHVIRANPFATLYPFFVHLLLDRAYAAPR
jgi:hypothetical protein